LQHEGLRSQHGDPITKLKTHVCHHTQNQQELITALLIRMWSKWFCILLWQTCPRLESFTESIYVRYWLHELISIQEIINWAADHVTELLLCFCPHSQDWHTWWHCRTVCMQVSSLGTIHTWLALNLSYYSSF